MSIFLGIFKNHQIQNGDVDPTSEELLSLVEDLDTVLLDSVIV